MTVKRLITLLSKEDPTATVLLSSDPEGNSFSLLSDEGIFTGFYAKDGYETSIAEAKGDLDGAKAAVVLFP